MHLWFEKMWYCSLVLNSNSTQWFICYSVMVMPSNHAARSRDPTWLTKKSLQGSGRSIVWHILAHAKDTDSCWLPGVSLLCTAVGQAVVALVLLSRGHIWESSWLLKDLFFFHRCVLVKWQCPADIQLFPRFITWCGLELFILWMCTRLAV